MNWYGTGIPVAENDDLSENSEEHNAESSLFDKNREISEMDRLKTVPFRDQVGVDYGSNRST